MGGRGKEKLEKTGWEGEVPSKTEVSQDAQGVGDGQVQRKEEAFVRTSTLDREHSKPREAGRAGIGQGRQAGRGLAKGGRQCGGLAKGGRQGRALARGRAGRAGTGRSELEPGFLTPHIQSLSPLLVSSREAHSAEPGKGVYSSSHYPIPCPPSASLFPCEVTGNNAFELPQAGSQSLIVKHLGILS